MQTLDISQINILAPYPVWYEGEEILFKTDYNILYSVAFELKDEIKPWRDEVTAPVRAYIKRICLFAYGEKVAILPKIATFQAYSIAPYAKKLYRLLT